MEEEVEEMSHICMYYEQEGKKAGLTEGMLIGEKRGMLIGERRGKILTQTANVERLMKKQLSMQEAFELLGIEKGMQEKVIQQFNHSNTTENKSNI